MFRKKTSAVLKSLGQSVREPVLLANLVLRLVLLALALLLAHWSGGDTRYYIASAAKVCSGDWGGDPSRSPFYMWFLCGLSPGMHSGAGWPAFFLPLLAQHLLAWAAGVWLFRKFGKLVAVLWLYDPVVLIYSNVVMTDLVFSVTVMFLGWQVYQLLRTQAGASKAALSKDPVWPQAAKLGVALGLCVLVRPIGQVLFFFSIFAFLFFAIFLPKFKTGRGIFLKKLGLAAVIAVLLLVPRLYWNASKYNIVGVENQGKYWIHGVAGALEHYGKGLDYVQSEMLWNQQHPRMQPADAYGAIVRHFPRWVYLTAQGVTRVLVGHVNTEWCMLFSGQAPIGPGWFKEIDQRVGWKIHGWQQVPWFLGILVSAFFSLAAYFILVRRVVKQRAFGSVYLWWCLGATALLAAAPQLWGDARFRLGFWPLLLIAMAVHDKKHGSV